MRMKILLKFIVVIQFAVAALAAPLFVQASDGWVACGNQGEDCDIATKNRVLVRYGSTPNNNYLFFGVEGQSAVPCSNFAGNPSDDDAKQCWYKEDTTVIPNDQWNKCADQGGGCNTGTNTPIWVKYGVGDKWLFTVQNRTFTCDNNHFGWNPDDGPAKACFVGYPAIFPSEGPDWTSCATQGNTCDLVSMGFANSSMIIRYGVDDSWNYKVAIQGDSFECNNENFGNPDDGAKKSCGVTPYQGSALKSEGVWEVLLDCNGDGCASHVSLSSGTKWSTSVSNQQTWSVGVTESIEEGIGIPPETTKSSLSSSQEYANSTEYQTALTTSFDYTATIDCGEVNSDEYKTIYQFITESTASCLTGDGGCNSKTHTTQYICYTGDVPLDGTPQCLPNACKPGTYCVECITD